MSTQFYNKRNKMNRYSNILTNKYKIVMWWPGLNVATIYTYIYVKTYLLYKIFLLLQLVSTERGNFT